MLKAPHGKAPGSKATGLLLASFVFLLVGYSLAGAITISPHKLVLNSQGNAEDVQAIIPMTIAAGYTFTAGEATLEFDGTEVAVSISMRYCYVDDNLIVGFDKEELLRNPDVIAMAGTTVTAKVEGSFIATDAEGNTYTKDFSGTDQVEIVAPGKNSANK
ncbi:hypothetical protein ACFLQW_00340 [Candidatus Zixiibacteriota bacterium]